MERVSFADLAPTVFGDGTARWALSDPLDAAHLAINRYRIPPGGGLPGGLHAHFDQEEVFVVLKGEATFETMPGEVPVGAGEAVRFAPGEFQSGRNDADGPLVVVALGAPRESEDVRIPVGCPGRDCDSESMRLVTAGSELAFVCPDCGTERHPSDCLACGCDDLRITLDDGGSSVAVCQGCGTTFGEPPLRE